MRAGRLDRRITIQGKVVTQDEFGGEVVTWSDVATVWAEKIENRGQERFSAQQFVGKSAKTFKIRWSATVAVVTTEHRVVFDGRQHDIHDVREVGRREGIEIDCTVRSEDPVDS
jgi:SPP1 family predicted phage head-tail adaptor